MEKPQEIDDNYNYGIVANKVSNSPMSNSDRTTSTFQLILYMLPVVGFFPSLWTVYRRKGTREQLVVSRLSITLALSWMLGYVLLATGAERTSDFLALRLLILNTFLTSGYFLVSVWLILHAVRGKTRRLPGLSGFAERVLGKYTP
jgi:hypothetical protein